MKRPSPQLLTLRVVVFACAVACAGCELTERDLQAFQSTATGPAKIRAVLEDGAKQPELRAYAAMLLFDLERHDLRGPEELQRELSAMTRDSREKLLTPLSRTLLSRMATERGVAPSKAAIDAKTAIESALPLLRGAQRKELGQTLLRWVVDDVQRRADAGGHSLEVLAASLGNDAFEPLLLGVRRDVPQPDLARLATLLDRHAAASARARAADQLIEVTRALHMPAALLPALGRFADQENVRKQLVTIAQDKMRNVVDRSQALTLLADHMTSGELLPLLGLALDEEEAMALRELAVRVGETGSKDALPGLLMLLGSRNHARLRRLSGERVLDIGGPKILASFFRALPNGWGMPYARDEIDAYSERINRFAPETALLLLLGEKLSSSLWWPRVIALRYFAARGTIEDLWRLRMHGSDTAPVLGDGWPRGYMVGNEAELCVTTLNERLLRNRKR